MDDGSNHKADHVARFFMKSLPELAFDSKYGIIYKSLELKEQETTIRDWLQTGKR